MILSPEVWGNLKWAGNVVFSSPFLWMIRPNGSGVTLVSRLCQFVDGKTALEFWLKPGGLRRHDVAGVCDVDKLFHRDRI